MKLEKLTSYLSHDTFTQKIDDRDPSWHDITKDFKSKSHQACWRRYEDKVFKFLINNRESLGIKRLWKLKNCDIDGIMELQSQELMPFEIKYCMNWLKACQAQWQLEAFLQNKLALFAQETGCQQKRVKCGTVFFKQFTGDWAMTSQKNTIRNGWLRWNREFKKLFSNKTPLYLVNYCDGQIKPLITTTKG